MVDFITIGPDYHLTSRDVSRVAYNTNLKIRLSAVAKRKVIKSRQSVERMIKGNKSIYGINTGYGKFKDKIIKKEDLFELQRNLIRGHSAGVGPAFDPEVVRAVLLVRLQSLAMGYSGIRLATLEFICNLLNRNVIPFVPSQGSVGASGDLAPLSHIGLVLMGEGRAWYKGKLLSGKEALRRAGLQPIEFNAKEGLALNNGTAVMTAIAALALDKAKRLADAADMGCALTLEAVCGVTSAFDTKIHSLRPHPGQKKSAANIRKFIRGSKLVGTIRGRIQDSYTLRCAPQVHGAARDAISYGGGVVEKELNSVTDNPLIFSNPDRAISGGNFHGEPIAIAADVLGIALSELANISERRIAKLVDPATSEGLPPFLVQPEKAGLHSGLMIAQYTAAALVSENKVLSHPASVDSIPTSANQEDHVSMGTIAARKALEIARNAENVFAIEFLTACQAVDFRDPRKLGEGTKNAYKSIRKITPFISGDRELATEISKVRSFLFLQKTPQPF